MRPRIGAVLAVLAVAAFPSAARAQAPDTTGPVITLTAPADNAVFTVGQAVVASYSCSDDTQVADCAGPVADGAALDTSTPGDRRFTVTAHDSAGNAGTLTHAYKVMPVLTLTLGQAPAFAPFLPGAGNDYTATMTATVESSAGSALLTMADPSASHPGHLMNGDAALPSGLTASATSPHGTSTGVQAVHDTADPTSLLSLGSPVSGEQVTLTFTQSIGASDLLRSGGYGKAFVFTISTTSP